MQNDRSIAEPLLVREQQSSRELGVPRMCADRKNRPYRRSLSTQFRRRAKYKRKAGRDRERARHVLVVPVFAAAADWLRHFTQITGAPNDT